MIPGIALALTNFFSLMKFEALRMCSELLLSNVNCLMAGSVVLKVNEFAVLLLSIAVFTQHKRK